MKTTPFDPADYLESPQDMAAYLDAILEDQEPRLLLAALQDIARAKGGMTWLSKQTGQSRESLYRTLSESGNPRFDSLLALMDALGLRLAVKTKAA